MRVPNYLVIWRIHVRAQNELPFWEWHHHFKSTQLFGTAPPVLSGYESETCSVLRVRDRLVTSLSARVWGYLAYHLLFHLPIGTNCPSGNPAEEPTARVAAWCRQLLRGSAQSQRAKRQHSSHVLFRRWHLGTLPRTLRLGHDPSLIGASLHPLQELRSRGHTLLPWVSLHSPVHGSGAADAKHKSVLLQGE